MIFTGMLNVEMNWILVVVREGRVEHSSLRERARQVSSTKLAEWTAAKHVTQRGAPKKEI
jgi:hypothetical protein